MRMKILAMLVLAIGSSLFSVKSDVTIAAMDKAFEPDLAKIVNGKGWTVENRKVTLIDNGGKKGVRFNEGPDVGVAWLDGYTFKNGAIDFDVKGRNVLQKSFVGLAFQAVDNKNYDAIYFRPFNFRHADPDHRAHAVQYVAAPDHGWKDLREAFPGKYEQPLELAPDPDGWFHVRILVDGKKVSVFVNHAATPSLVVEKLTESREGKIGLWVGDASDGSFANLRISSLASR